MDPESDPATITNSGLEQHQQIGAAALVSVNEGAEPADWADSLGASPVQFTYFQQAGGRPLAVPAVEITYGLERILMSLQVCASEQLPASSA